MITEKKLDIVEDLLREHVQYKENRQADYNGPYFDYVRNVGSIDVFTEGYDRAFYWVQFVCDIANAVRKSLYVSYDPDKGCVFAHIH